MRTAVPLLLLSALSHQALASEPWADPQRPSRVEVRVSAGGHARIDTPVEVRWSHGASVRVVEIDEAGKAIDPSIDHQVDPGQDLATLVFLLRGQTPPGKTRRFHVYHGAGKSAAPRPLVTVEDNVPHQGQESFRITTPAGVYLYHKAGAGFAGLIDKDGSDWISYRPGGGSAGQYRGIPNLIHPGNQFHPGGEGSTSKLLSRGPLRCVIHSSTDDGKWEGLWEIYPHHARFTVLKAHRPYWFLYEGTPGGQLDVDSDYWVRSSGEKLPVSENWEGRLPPPRWVCFGDARLRRVLWLAHHEDDGDYDQFWQMQGNMTVFGFGRKYRCCDKSLDQAPARFSFGLAETDDFARISRLVRSASEPLDVTLLPPEPRRP